MPLLYPKVVLKLSMILPDIGGTRYSDHAEDTTVALCRWTLGGERHRYAIASPGTDPMLVDGLLH